MKKVLMALFAFVAAASLASAGVGIQWTTQNWGEYHDLSGTAILQNNSVLWQLIYAGADGIANPISQTSGFYADASSGYVQQGSDDVVWAERTIAQMGGTAPEDGTSWDEWLMNAGGTVVYEDLSWSTAGYVYQRVFESSSPVHGTYFFESAPFEYNHLYAGGGQPTETFNVDLPTGPFTPNQQVNMIPEPATMGLLGLGALVMAIRRRRS